MVCIMFEEEKKRIKELTEERWGYNDVANRISDINAEIHSIKSDMFIQCEKDKHPNAVIVSQFTDSYEGRTYANISCPDCGDVWEERIYCGKLPYPLKEGVK